MEQDNKVNLQGSPMVHQGSPAEAGGVLPRVRASWPREAIELLAERVAIMLADTGGADEGEVETWAEAAVRAYWAVLRGGLHPERARVERLGEEPWRVGGEG